MRRNGFNPDKVVYMILVEAAFEHWLRMGRRPDHLEHIKKYFKKSRLDIRAGVAVQELDRPQYDRKGVKNKRPLVIDLHGVSKWSAVVQVIASLQVLQARVAENPHAIAARPIHIVTGRGNNSAVRNQPVFRDTILVLLQRMDIPVSFHRDTDGCLVVQGKALTALLQGLTQRGVTLNLEYCCEFVAA